MKLAILSLMPNFFLAPDPLQVASGPVKLLVIAPQSFAQIQQPLDAI